MNKALFKKNLPYIFLFLVLGCFVLLRLDAISIAYFWDEAWVYGPAVHEMANNGPSPLPGAIQEDLSRGHPMLFHFTSGLFLFLLGNTVTNAHVFALLISLCTLFVIFKISREFLSDLYSILVVISLASFPLFIGQSVMVYPEMMLTLFALLTFYFYLKKSGLYFFISASFLLLTKETGLIFLFSLAIWSVIRTLFIDKKKIFSADFIKSQLPFIFPLLPLFAFFTIQKIKFGYVFFPEHIGLIEINLRSVEYMVRSVFRTLFEYDYRFWIYISFGALFLLLHKKVKLKHRVIIFILYFCQYKILFGFWPTNHFFAVLTFIVLSVFIFSVYLFSIKSSFSVQDEMMLVSFAFILIFIVFSAINFFTERYVLVCLPFCLLMCFGLLAQVKYSKQVGTGFCAIILSTNFYFLATTSSGSETTPYYKNVVLVQQDMVHYFESAYSEEDKIYCDFIHSNALNNRFGGFKKQDIWFNTNDDSTQAYTFWVTDNVTPKDFYKSIENRKDTKLLKEFKHGDVELRIYTGF
jgi:4-amino-4-deoxy-L-arabinose transferase-like glycosyltransferase